MSITTSPSPAAFDPETVAELVNDLYISRRALISSAAWALYDYALTFEQEVTYVWVKPWGVAKVLFFWTRYVGLCLLLLAVAGSILPGPVPQVCLMVYYCGAWGGMVTMGTVSAIMAVRIYAMYAGSKRVGIFLGILLILYFSAEVSMLYFSLGSSWIPPVEYLSLGLNPCFSGTTLRLSMGIWIARLLMDATLLTFAAFKSFQQWQQGWSSSIINLLVQDNVLAFVFLLSVQILNLTLEGVVQPQATLAGIGYAIAADVIIGTRLLLHTREVMYAADDPGSVQLTEFIVRPELDLAERTQVSLGDDILGLPRLAIMPEEAEEDRHTYGEVTPIEEGDSARALVFRKRS